MNKWKKNKLSNLCLKIGDGLHGTPEYTEEPNFFFINGNNLENGKIIINKNTKKITEKEYKKNYISLNQNSLLLSINGSIGSMAFYYGEKVMLGKSVAYLNFKSNINNFYYYYFQLPDLQEFFFNNATGSTIKNLSLDTIRNLEVPEPDINEWTKISKTLSYLDLKIDLNNKINTELEKVIKTLFNYWFVQFDFPDANGKSYKFNGGKMKWSKKFNRDIPVNWAEGTFKDILKNIESGDRPEGGIKNIKEGIPSVGAENVLGIGKYLYIKEKFISEVYFSKMMKGKIKSGDVLVYKDGAGLGRVSIFKNNFPYKTCAINSHVFILRTNDRISQNYLYFWLDQNYIKRKITQIGMTSAQPGINQRNVNDLPILIPDKELIVNFENIITSSIDMIFENSKENKVLSDLKNWLLPMVMNGQIKII